MKRISLVLSLSLLVAAPLLAHDFWLASSAWHVAPGAKVTVTANIGERFPVATNYTRPERVASLMLIGPKIRRDVSAFRREGNSLAADVQLPTDPGTYLIAMVIKPLFIQIDAPDFTTYLAHEGLERVIAERERWGQASKPGRERYSRYAKLVIRSGGGPADDVTRPAALAVELVPFTDPTRLRVGDGLTVQLLFEGQPVAGALVGAIYAASKGAPDEWPLKARTDGRGQATFRLTERGPWLIRSVHMVRRANETGPEAVDWESYWASLTFDVAGQ